MNQADIDEFTAVFNIFDRNHSGSISRRELTLCLTQCGFNVNATGTQSLLAKFDTDGDHKLSLQEFIELAKSLAK